MLRLKKLLVRYAGEPERLGYYLLQDVWQLGDIQPAYTALASKDPASRDYRASVGQLLASVRRWEMDYCLEAPASGGARAIRTCPCRVASCSRGSCRKSRAAGSA